MNENFLTLFQLNKLIQESLKTRLNNAFWVKAEIAQIKENYSGHCYLELVEKDKLTDKIVAQSKGTIWANTYRMLKPYFETTTNRKLAVGINILISVKVEFHEVYGLSLNISDIDPSYTVGDLALKKAEVIKRLKDEGVFDINHGLTMPLIPQRIAVISSETAAGYKDFITHLDDNQNQYRFTVKLFPAFMQGEKSEESIVNALEIINKKIHNYDIVAIIRGGGSQVDLSCFDSYWVSLHVAQFPIPVLTGIGHEQDDSIVDMVAHTRLKTPTAVADYLIETLNDFENHLDNTYIHVAELARMSVSEHLSILEHTLLNLPVIIKDSLHKETSILNQFIHQTSKIIERKIQEFYYMNKMNINKIAGSLKHNISAKKQEIKINVADLKRILPVKLENHSQYINKYEKIAELVNPENILKKGFSITYFKDYSLKDNSSLSENDIITTRLYKGRIISKVQSTRE
jgi:exodeoxyribonuclease VII large subunit